MGLIPIHERLSFIGFHVGKYTLHSSHGKTVMGDLHSVDRIMQAIGVALAKAEKVPFFFPFFL